MGERGLDSERERELERGRGQGAGKGERTCQPCERDWTREWQACFSHESCHMGACGKILGAPRICVGAGHVPHHTRLPRQTE